MLYTGHESTTYWSSALKSLKTTKPEAVKSPADEVQFRPQKLWLIVSVCIFAVSLFVLWWNAAPSVTFHDSGEFAMAAASAGIPHPPGAPTWVILASAFIRIGGFADPARGTNLFSGFCGALTLALLAYIAQLWASLLFPSAPRWLSPFAGITSALVLMRSPAFLEQSFTTEQYALLTAFFAAIMLVSTLLILPGSNRRKVRLSMLLGLLMGLAIGNHLSQVSLLLLVALAVWLGAPRGTRLKSTGACLAGLFLGLLVFLWLPIRSHADPLLDWGNIETWDRFVWAITRKQWETRPLSQAPPGFALGWITSYDPLGQLGIVGLLLTALGLVILAIRGRLWLGWLGAAIIPYAVGLLLGHMHQASLEYAYIRAYGVMDWHLPIYLGCAVAAAIGAGFIAQWICARSRPASLIGALLILLCLIAVAGLQIEQSSLRKFTAPKDFIAALLAPTSPDAIILLTADNCIANAAYDRYIAHPNSTRWITFRTQSVDMLIPTPGSSTENWKDRRVDYLTKATIQPDGQPLRVPPLSTSRARKGRVFIDYSGDSPSSVKYMLPAGFLVEMIGHPTTDEEVYKADRRWQNEYSHKLRKPYPGAQRLEREAWQNLYVKRGDFFSARSMWNKAVANYLCALEWLPGNPYIWYDLGNAFKQLGQLDKAEKAYLSAIQIEPCYIIARVNLGTLYAEAGMLDAAEMMFEETLRIDPSCEAARHNLDIIRSIRTANPQY